MEEDLINKTSIQFPTVTNTSDNDSFLFDDMTPMIEIPTSIVLRQLEEGKYIYVTVSARTLHVSLLILAYFSLCEISLLCNGSRECHKTLHING